MTQDTRELVEKLRNSKGWPTLGNAAATALTAQAERIAELEAALRLHQAWSDSEDSGPNYGGQTRDTHPDGERIWRQWWEGNLDLCARAQEATRAAIAGKGEALATGPSFSVRRPLRTFGPRFPAAV